MPFNLLIFPIIGGYYVLIRSELFRYRQQRIESHQLVLNSILAGMVLLFPAWLITLTLSKYAPDFVILIKGYYPLKITYFGTAVCSLILSILLTELSNLIVNKDKSISSAIRKIGTEFDMLCEECYRGADLVQFTLKNGKCYVGWIQSLPIPSRTTFIRIFPVYSGYRKPKNKALVLNTQYLDIYASYVQDGSVTDVTELTTLVINTDEIISASTFDNDMWDRFQQTGQVAPPLPANP